MKSFGGPVLLLDRADINTDEIIPAKYLTEAKKEALKPYLLEDLKLEGFAVDGKWRGTARVVIARANFGCGSSREHAPWAFEVNDITCIVAESYARIFRQNMFNGGMLAIELEPAIIDEIFALGKKADLNCAVNIDAKTLIFTWAEGSRQYPFMLTGFDAALVQSGGWVEFADAKY
jgi:3-isopropylmalate/(R)-2-methylmalate dehydratase small subunit